MPSGPGPSESSAPRSNGDLPKGGLASRRNLESTAASAIVATTSFLHETLADEEEQAHGLFLATDKEVDGIAEAAAGLLSRRVPPGVGNPDFADLVQLAILAGGYVVRAVQTRRAIRRARRAAVMADLTAEHDQAAV